MTRRRSLALADRLGGDMSTLHVLLPVVGLTTLAAVLRFSFLNRQSFWFDEAVTVELSQKSLSGMLAALPDTESTPPLYYVLVWAWSRLIGPSEAELRALSALFGTATVPVAYAVGRLLVSHRAGLYTAALVTCSPFLVWYSQEARGYAVFLALSTLALLVFAHALLRPSSRGFALWAVVAALALATHYFSVFLVGGEAVWLVLRHRRCRAAWAAATGVAAAGAALLPLALHQQRTGQTAWIDGRPLRDRMSQTLRQFVTGEYGPSEAVSLLALVVLGFTVAGLVWFTEGREQRGGTIALVLGAAAVVAPLALAATELDKFFYRNLIAAWVPLAIALATVLASQRIRRLGLVILAATCAIQLWSLSIVVRRPSLHRDDWRSALEALGPGDGRRAIITEPSYEKAVIQLYRPEVRPMPTAGKGVAEIVFLGLSRLPLHFRPPPAFERVEERMVQHIALVRYRSPTVQTVTPADLARRGAFSPSGVLVEANTRSTDR
jgi:mannosyltransferase